ncbi:Tumor susceptibility -like protein [Trichinella pseudospiralis]|uniref:Tumor susceptibility-like protein n=1 Tax=Trichinella pseudospiralis TaxID=6337 RepID=A0A0V1ISC9_TRIPS|nr:Tumor susceptibility -like protein [Trichinella pseudospiralis]
MNSESLTAMLKSIGAEYLENTKEEIMEALSQFHDLIVRKDFYENWQFVFVEQSLLIIWVNMADYMCYMLFICSSLTLLGKTYNIPICIYLLKNYPHVPPICFVRPTASMIVKPSSNVDSNGKINVPYLTEWHQSKSDLLGLLQVLAIVFGESCPVFNKPANSRPFASQQSASFYPSDNVMNDDFARRNRRPVPPIPNQPDPSVCLPGPPYPLGTPYPIPLPARYPPYPNAVAHSSNSALPSCPRGSSSVCHGTSSAGFTSYPSVLNRSCANNSLNTTGTIQPEHIRASMLSAAEDLLRKKLREIIGRTSAELHSLRRSNEELELSKNKVKTILQDIADEEARLKTVASVYKERSELIDSILENVSEDDVKIDDAIDTTAPLYRQIVKCCTEDATLDDTIYYLGEALKKGKLELEPYLKLVRELSRQQFMQRATMQKCRIVAGLDKE